MGPIPCWYLPRLSQADATKKARVITKCAKCYFERKPCQRATKIPKSYVAVGESDSEGSDEIEGERDEDGDREMKHEEEQEQEEEQEEEREAEQEEEQEEEPEAEQERMQEVEQDEEQAQGGENEEGSNKGWDNDNNDNSDNSDNGRDGSAKAYHSGLRRIKDNVADLLPVLENPGAVDDVEMEGKPLNLSERLLVLTMTRRSRRSP